MYSLNVTSGLMRELLFSLPRVYTTGHSIMGGDVHSPKYHNTHNTRTRS